VGTRRYKFFAVFLGWAIFLATDAGGQEKTVLVETGSSMPEPLYKSWIDEFHQQQPSTDIRYMAVGTGESARNILAGSGDFGGGDAPIPEAQLRASGKSILELPVVLIGIVIIYELPDVKGELKLTGPVLANIFLGKIKAWNDPAIAKLNPEMKLPELSVQVLHRNEGKGSNYILSDYLAKVSPEFLATAGRSESPKWPVGQAFQRSQDLVAKLRGTPGAIGYTELNIAAGSGVRIASIKNAAGEFVKPSANSIGAAATASGSKMNNDFRLFSDECNRQSKLSDQQFHVALCASRRQGFRPGQRRGQLPEVGLHQRPKGRPGKGLRNLASRSFGKSGGQGR